MTDGSESPLAPMLHKLRARGTITADDAAAVLALPHRLQSIARHGHIVREGNLATHSCLLRSGFVFRHKQTGAGRRQICSLHVSGDMVDLQNSLLLVADHAVQALTDIEVALIPRAAILDLAHRHRAVGEAMWYDTLVDAAVFREWMTSIGQRDAVARLAHLICEFGVRFEAAGLGSVTLFELPMTQEQLADSTGLTPVHVNRTLRKLKDAGLIAIRNRSVSILDWTKLAAIGDFDRAYLHLPDDWRRVQQQR